MDRSQLDGDGPRRLEQSPDDITRMQACSPSLTNEAIWTASWDYWTLHDTACLRYHPFKVSFFPSTLSYIRAVR